VDEGEDLVGHGAAAVVVAALEEDHLAVPPDRFEALLVAV